MGAFELCGGDVRANRPGHSRAVPGLRYDNTVEYRRSSDEEEEKEWGLRTDFVEEQNRDILPSTSHLCTTSVLPHPLPVSYGTQ